MEQGKGSAVRDFGEFSGRTVREATLTSDAGVAVSVMSYGAIVRDWQVPHPDGRARHATLGFETFPPYLTHSRSFGIIAGRLANRVGNARFSLAGTSYTLDANTPPDHLHGGREGLGKQLWDLEADRGSVRLTLTSPDGAMGYPGEVAFTVEISLEGHTLTFHMHALPDRPTPIALAQHSYYTLGGPIPEHELSVAATRITPTDERKIPTGALEEIAGTRYDFRRARPVGEAPLDMNYCLDSGEPAAHAAGRDMTLRLVTDRPGLQVFNAYNFPDIPVAGLGGTTYGRHAGLALEAQDWPDAVNHEHFPDVIATPERPYRQTTAITIEPR